MLVVGLIDSPSTSRMPYAPLGGIFACGAMRSSPVDSAIFATLVTQSNCSIVQSSRFLAECTSDYLLQIYIIIVPGPTILEVELAYQFFG